MTQSGPNVVATASGSIDTSLLTFYGSPFGAAQGSNPSDAFIGLGGSPLEGYSGLSGPLSFGAGGFAFGTSTTGSGFEINGSTSLLFLPVGYLSGSAVSDTETWAGQTITSLGFTPGTYVYRAGRTDMVTINVASPAGVPEPSTWAMILSGFAVVGLALRRKRRAGRDRSAARASLG